MNYQMLKKWKMSDSYDHKSLFIKIYSFSMRPENKGESADKEYVDLFDMLPQEVDKEEVIEIRE